MRQKKQWVEHRDSIRLAQQYRARVQLTPQLHEAAAKVAQAYSVSSFQESRDAATTWTYEETT